MYINYVYDSIDQLKREVSNEPTPTYDLTYDYDKMGNRTAKTDGSGSYSDTANFLLPDLAEPGLPTANWLNRFSVIVPGE